MHGMYVCVGIHCLCTCMSTIYGCPHLLKDALLPLQYTALCNCINTVVAESKGEATNCDALSFCVCIYVCMYVYPPQSIRDTSTVQLPLTLDSVKSN